MTKCIEKCLFKKLHAFHKAMQLFLFSLRSLPERFFPIPVTNITRSRLVSSSRWCRRQPIVFPCTLPCSSFSLFRASQVRFLSQPMSCADISFFLPEPTYPRGRTQAPFGFLKESIPVLV